jgi:nucleoside-diphosphate-sugar epimerase
MRRILMTGALGQIGSELVILLREKYGGMNVIATDLKSDPPEKILVSGPFEIADCTDYNRMKIIIEKYKIDTIFHLAAILSGLAEAKPQLAWEVNINGTYIMLELAREYHCAVFIPSSIGVFGPGTPLDNTPQETIQRPNTIYGVTKVTGELLCDYYYKKYGVDTRGVRYPGIISNETLPGGGTTDYAVEIFYEAVRNKKYTCYIKKGTYLDMMYMPDALNAAIKLMEVDSSQLKHRNAYNVSSMSVAPENFEEEIKKHIPGFQMDYEIDPIRQEIAESWPNIMDDSAARNEWNWKPEYDLEKMTGDMLKVLSQKLLKH